MVGGHEAAGSNPVALTGGNIMSKDCSYEESPFVVAWLIVSYVLYWPMFWLMYYGGEHFFQHRGTIDWGEPGFWVVLWITAPITTWIFAFGAFLYWVLGPIMSFLTPYLVPFG